MSNKFKAGDLVEVRPAGEILATLDEEGSLENLPFMPEMLPYVGKRFRVSRRAHKTCDTVHQTGGRWLGNCVHLEDLRCDGDGHDGCKASCLLFWKTAWLRPVPAGSALDGSTPGGSVEELTALRSLVSKGTKRNDARSEDIVYRCQATALYDASRPLAWYDVRQYAEDLTSGNTGLRHMLRVWFFNGLRKLMGLGVGYGLSVRVYDFFQRRIGGYENPFRSGSIPEGEKTPARQLDLVPGEKVRIRSHQEILATLNRANKNRGMYFDVEMVPYCGKTYTVRRRVDRIIHETTGRMIEIKTPSVILDGVVCRSEMSSCRLFCPRAIPSYWREIWLERVGAEDASPTPDRSPQAPG
ncbi:hypothetical protein [Lentisalinibacter orientalis]|uniref:hypothetical protein n=1 Tax=Lentisalinibacter orientalis TaxID=2992241 RepID=UPI00386CB059